MYKVIKITSRRKILLQELKTRKEALAYKKGWRDRCYEYFEIIIEEKP